MSAALRKFPDPVRTLEDCGLSRDLTARAALVRRGVGDRQGFCGSVRTAAVRVEMENEQGLRRRQQAVRRRYRRATHDKYRTILTFPNLRAASDILSRTLPGPERECSVLEARHAGAR
jgi:hypothetical protein